MKTTLHKMYTLELHLLLNRERQILEALPGLINASTNDDLKKALSGHRDETEEQATHLEAILEAHDEDIANGKTCGSLKTLLNEGGDIIDMTGDDHAAKDVAIIGGARTVEDFEMARYTIVIELADALGYDDDKKTLEAIYKEEETAGKKLTELAEGGILSKGMAEEAAE